MATPSLTLYKPPLNLVLGGMKIASYVLVIFSACYAFGLDDLDSLEGVWVAERFPEFEISYCDGLAASNVPIGDGKSVKVEIPYKLIGGNSASFILEYEFGVGEELVQNIGVSEKGITVESMNCKASPEACKASFIALYQEVSQQHASVDIDPILQGLNSVDFTNTNISTASYVYARACK